MAASDDTYIAVKLHFGARNSHITWHQIKLYTRLVNYQCGLYLWKYGTPSCNHSFSNCRFQFHRVKKKKEEKLPTRLALVNYRYGLYVWKYGTPSCYRSFSNCRFLSSYYNMNIDFNFTVLQDEHCSRGVAVVTELITLVSCQQL